MCSIVDLFLILAPLLRNVQKIVNIYLHKFLVRAPPRPEKWKSYFYVWEGGGAFLLLFLYVGAFLLRFFLYVAFSPCGAFLLPLFIFHVWGLFCPYGEPFWACHPPAKISAGAHAYSWYRLK